MSNLSLELDLLAAKLDAKGQGVACGGGWISPRAKCSKGKSKTTSKENLAKTTERRKKMHGLKAEVAADKGKKAKDKVTPDWDKKLGELEGIKKGAEQPERKRTSSKGEQFAQEHAKPWMKKSAGFNALIDAVDYNGGVVDTGKNREGYKGGTNVGVVKVTKLNPPSKKYRHGSASIISDTGLDGPEKNVVDLMQLSDGISHRIKSEPKDKPSLKVLPGGEKSLKDLFKEADRIGSKYQEPGEPASISAKRAAKRILKESGYDQVSDIASGKVRRIPDRSKAPLKARERPTSVRGVSIDSLLLDLELLKYSRV
jgi:hypothetical protein